MRELLAAEGYGSLICTPVAGGREQAYAGVVLFQGSRTFTDEDVLLTRHVSDAAKGALERGELFEGERRARMFAQRLARLGTLLGTTLDPAVVLEEVAREAPGLLDADAAVIRLLDADDLVVRTAHGPGVERLEATSSSSSLALSGAVVQARAPHVVRDGREQPRLTRGDLLLEEDMRAAVAVPMVAHGSGLYGVLAVYARTPRTWREDELESLAALAAAASASIANAELYQRVAEERERGAAILANIADGIVAVGRDDRIVLWNAMAEHITGVPASEALGRLVPEVLQRELAAGESEPPGERYVAVRRGGNEVWIALSEAVMLDPSGGVAGRVFAFRDVSSERVVEQMKSDFVSTVSHELRTPLTSIYGFAETLMRSDVDFSDPERTTFLRYIASESERLIGIVDDLLNVARLEAGTLAVALAPTDLGSVAREAAIRDRGACERGPPLRRRDRARRARCPRGPGEARPGVGRSSGQRRGLFARRRHDHGVGSAPRGHGRDRRCRRGRRHRPCRSPADLHQVLPVGARGRPSGLRPRALPRPRPGDRHGRAHLGRVRRGPGLALHVRAPARRRRARRRAARGGRGGAVTHVLVIDDEAPIRLLCRVNLEAEGMGVSEAGDGPGGLDLARAERPDVILLDVMMPGLDGWRVAEMLLDDPATSEIPIVFLTARADVRDRARGIDLGGLEYITKPFNPVELATLVRKVLTAVQQGERERLRSDKIAQLRELFESA